MYGNRRRRKKPRSAGFIPPAMMVLMIFVALFAVLLMVFAIMRGKEDRARKSKEEVQNNTAIAEVLQTVPQTFAETGFAIGTASIS